MKKLISFHSPLDTAGRIDDQNAVIHGVSVITSGIEAEGHSLWIDEKTVDQLLSSANKAGKIPVKLDHGSGVSSLCGYITNFRKEGNSLRGDWHLLKSHDETEKMLERARVMPSTFGLSVCFAGKGESIGNGKMAARCEKLKAIDCVTDPAANVNGLFSVRHSFSDARARNPQGQFMGNEAGGAHPASMAAAYGGQAQQKRSQVQKILSALKLRKPVLPAQNPTLASRGRTINFMAKWSDGKKVQKGDRLSPKLDGIHVKATREGLFTKNGQPIKGQDHIRGALSSHFQKNPHAEVTGELYQHGMPLEEIVSHARTGAAKLQLHVHPGQNAPEESAHIKHIPESAIADEGDLEAAHNHAVENGYEGLVIRRNTGKTFKKKSLQDSEYEILGGSTGKKHGILHLKGDKGTFSVQAPRHIAEAAPVGKKATVAYQRLTNSGVPHSPIFKGVRHDMQSKLKTMAFNFAAPLDSQTRKSVDTTSRQSDEELMEQWGVAAQEMDRRNVLRLKAGMRPLSLQEVFDELQASRTRLRGFGALNSNDDQNQPSPLRDAAVGGLEGAAGYFVTDKLARALAPAGSGILRKAGVAGAVGAAGTMVAGSILNQIAKRRQQQQGAPVMANPRQDGSFPRSGFSSTRRLVEMAQKIDNLQHSINGGIPLTGRVAHDRLVRDVYIDDANSRDKHVAEAAGLGAAAGALGKAGVLSKIGTAGRAGIGAGLAGASVLGIRAITNKHRDIYGDRTRASRGAEMLPAAVAGIGAGHLAVAALRKKYKFSTPGDQRKNDESRRLRDDAIGAGAVAAGSGIASGGYHIGKAAQQHERLAKAAADTAEPIAGGVKRAAAMAEKLRRILKKKVFSAVSEAIELSNHDQKINHL